MEQVTFQMITENQLVNAFLIKAEEYMRTSGYTEHGLRHARLVAQRAQYVLTELGYSPRECELARIAGYLHDVGNVVNREHHGTTGAVLLSGILLQMGMAAAEVATVIGAIGNHEEANGQPVNSVAAALILADKSDVHRSRVSNTEFATFDLHDRVNYAVDCSALVVDPVQRTITLELSIDTKICPVIEYFEIFLSRMMLCRKAAIFLNCTFALVINGAKLL